MGVSPRSLQRDFQTHIGMSPRQYLEQVESLAPTLTFLPVPAAPSQISPIVGVSGTFRDSPRRYRERYGEVPSQTLRTSKSEP